MNPTNKSKHIELSFLKTLSNNIINSQTVENLLSQSIHSFENAFKLKAIGIFGWIFDFPIFFQQRGLESILIKDNSKSFPDKILPENEWADPVITEAYIRKIGITQQRNFYINRMQNFTGNCGLLIIEPDENQTVPDDIFEIASTLVGISLQNHIYFHASEIKPALNDLNTAPLELVEQIKALRKEFKMPLRVISNYLTVINQEVHRVDPHKKYLEVIRNKVKMLDLLSGRLDDFAKHYK